MVARRAHNPKVVGSNPAPAIIWSGRFCPLYFFEIHIVAVCLY
jgi:hypothetical protein